MYSITFLFFRIARYVLFFLQLAQCIPSYISFSFYMTFLGVVLTKFIFWLSFSPILGLNIGWTIYVSFATYKQNPLLGNDICWFDRELFMIFIFDLGSLHNFLSYKNQHEFIFDVFFVYSTKLVRHDLFLCADFSFICNQWIFHYFNVNSTQRKQRNRRIAK